MTVEPPCWWGGGVSHPLQLTTGLVINSSVTTSPTLAGERMLLIPKVSIRKNEFWLKQNSIFGCMRFPLTSSNSIFYEMEPQSEQKRKCQVRILMVNYSKILLNKISNSLLQYSPWIPSTIWSLILGIQVGSFVAQKNGYNLSYPCLSRVNECYSTTAQRSTKFKRLQRLG